MSLYFFREGMDTTSPCDGCGKGNHRILYILRSTDPNSTSDLGLCSKCFRRSPVLFRQARDQLLRKLQREAG